MAINLQQCCGRGGGGVNRGEVLILFQVLFLREGALYRSNMVFNKYYNQRALMTDLWIKY